MLYSLQSDLHYIHSYFVVLNLIRIKIPSC